MPINRIFTSQNVLDLQWRKFSFFDIHRNVDNGKVAECLQVSDFVLYSTERKVYEHLFYLAMPVFVL